MTINISFGDEELKEWLETLEKPYPLFFIDLNWAERFPDTIEMMRKKNITIGLLGANGNEYNKNNMLLKEQMLQYEKTFGTQPLWFRTKDEHFPEALRNQLWTYEVNALASTTKWTADGKIPQQKGEIIAATSSAEEELDIESLASFLKSRDFFTIEEVLFGHLGKSKKIPQ